MGGKLSKKYTTNPTKNDFIGRGTYGEVYRARRILDNKLIAIKKIKLKKDTDRRDIVNEVRRLEYLSKDPNCHPNIVCIYDYEITSTHINIFMELVEGDELDLIDFKDPQKYYKAFLEFAKGLQYLHETSRSSRY